MSILTLVVTLSVVLLQVQACSPPNFTQFQDTSYTASAKCPDLILYPVNSVDQNDQYRFDYSDVSYGNTHSQGETVAISCSSSGSSQTTVEGFDQQRESITSSSSLIATCSNVGGSRYTWTIQNRVLQFVDCR
ncbi:hypothetical protein M3Y97_00732000 [Aphelenchoides bicaudatus]|nr:hypothetical protein M3Y97_00732000 [Aphelenchoides bicaudatus]